MQDNLVSMPQNLDKTQRYEWVLAQSFALLEDTTQPWYSCLSNITAVLHRSFNWWWTGFYLVNEDKLKLGPFQGDVACTEIAFGKGVCGAAWKQMQSIIVPDVHAFPGHIACSAASNSEIVVPIIQQDGVIAVLDVDSQHFNHFDTVDQKYLELLMNKLSETLRLP